VKKVIGFCGFPQHGKSTAQDYLQSEYGVAKLDDSEELRRLSMSEFNLTEDDVYTQEGKSSLIPAYGQIISVREAMGTLGEEYEAKYGKNYWVERAIENMNNDGPASFGSIRMKQGQAIKDVGGVVVRIQNDRKLESCNGFDQFEESLIDFTINNNSDLGVFYMSLQLVYEEIRTIYGW